MRKTTVKRGLVVAGCVIAMASMCVGCSNYANGDRENESYYQSIDHMYDYKVAKNEAITAYIDEEYATAYGLLTDVLEMVE